MGDLDGVEIATQSGGETLDKKIATQTSNEVCMCGVAVILNGEQAWG